MPAVPELTVSTEVPDPVTLLGLRVAVRPTDGLAVSMTVPVNPLIGEMVIVEVAVALAFAVRVVGDAVMVKLGLTRCMLMTKVLWKVKVK